jgi:hypothetical protein
MGDKSFYKAQYGSANNPKMGVLLDVLIMNAPKMVAFKIKKSYFWTPKTGDFSKYSQYKEQKLLWAAVQIKTDVQA